MRRLAIIIFLSSLFIFCCGFKHLEKRSGLTITPTKLQLFVNQQTDPYTIRVAYTLNVPADYLPSCARLVYQPYFVAPGQEYKLTPLVISGKEYVRRENRLEVLTGKDPEYPDAMHLLSEGDGMKIKLLEIVPFQLWMPGAKLRARVWVESCDRKTDLYDLTLAEGVFYLPMGPGPVRVKYIKGKDGTTKIVPL